MFANAVFRRLIMFRTITATFLATVLLSTLAAACSSSDGGDEDAGLPAAAAAADAPAAEVGDSVVTQEFDLSIELTSSVLAKPGTPTSRQ